jgi:hypothetical protein
MHLSLFYKLEERARLPAFLFVLVQESKMFFIEFFEELIPRNRLKLVFSSATREINPQKTDVIRIARPLNARGMPAAIFNPAFDLLMIGRDLSLIFGHG